MAATALTPALQCGDQDMRFNGAETITVGAYPANAISRPTRAIYCGATQTVNVQFISGDNVAFVGLPAGTVLPVIAVGVTVGASGNLVALFE